MIRHIVCIGIAFGLALPAIFGFAQLFRLRSWERRMMLIGYLDTTLGLAAIGIVVAFAIWYAWPYLAERFNYEPDDADRL